MPYSYLSHLRCSKTGEMVDADQPQQLSPVGAPLLASYDLEALKQAWHPAALLGRPASLWRYHELLPVRDPAQVVTLGEGFTPLLPLPRLGKQVGIPDLWMKDESLTPTGSFKARGAAVGVSRARELGVSHFAMPTNGNAGAAWALYGARAGLCSTIVQPQAAPAITRLESALAGARLYLVDASSATPVARWPRRWCSRGCSMPPPSRSPIASRARRPWGLKSPSSSAGPCRT